METTSTSGESGETRWPDSMLCRVLVGRDDESRRLHAAFEDARHGSGRVVFVAGVAGVGKSRLTRELAARARSAGAPVLVGRASATSLDSPLRPLREALLGLARSGYRPDDRDLEPFRPALARLVPDWGPSEAADTSAVVLGEGLLRLLEAQSSRRGPALLVLDDLHWADRETLAVVEYLADNIDTHHVLVVGTLRDDDLGPGRESANALVARRTALWLRLDALDARGVETMARSCLGRDDLPEGLAAALVARSEGIPFLVEELLATAASTGALNSQIGGEPSTDRLRRTVPATVLASVTVRLHALSNARVRLLRTAALLGRHFDWELAALAAGCPTSEAPDHFRSAVLAQLLEVDGDGYRFRHALDTRRRACRHRARRTGADGCARARGVAHDRSHARGRPVRARGEPCDRSRRRDPGERATGSGRPTRARRRITLVGRGAGRASPIVVRSRDV